MGKRLAALVIVLGFVLPLGAAAGWEYRPSDYPGQEDRLVEGHTVFAVIEVTFCVRDDLPGDPRSSCNQVNSRSTSVQSKDERYNVSVQRMGSAVAVLVRDRVKEVPDRPPGCGSNKDVVVTLFHENPAVLWFNDQFLLGDDLDLVEVDVDANVDVCRSDVASSTDLSSTAYRYPCGGWIWATQAGNPDPRDPLLPWLYEESYYITDPNDRTWIVDKYGPVPFGRRFAPIERKTDRNSDTDPPDRDYDDWADGDERYVLFAHEPATQMQYYLGQFNLWVVPVWTGTVGTPDGGPTGPSCGPVVDAAPADPAYPVPAASYNAVLFFFFDDLRLNGLRVHGTTGQDNGDTSYCQPGTEWSCGLAGVPGDDDEGNSHPWNNESSNSGPRHVHPTAPVDLYFHNGFPPPLPDANGDGSPDRLYAVYDGAGSGVPRHLHDDETDGFDERVAISKCDDQDTWSEQWTYTWYTSNDTRVQTGHSYTKTQNSHRETHIFGRAGPENDGECKSEGYGGGTTGQVEPYPDP